MDYRWSTGELSGVKLWYGINSNNLEIRKYPNRGYEVWHYTGPECLSGEIVAGPFDTFEVAEAALWVIV